MRQRKLASSAEQTRRQSDRIPPARGPVDPDDNPAKNWSPACLQAVHPRAAHDRERHSRACPTSRPRHRQQLGDSQQLPPGEPGRPHRHGNRRQNRSRANGAARGRGGVRELTGWSKSCHRAYETRGRMPPGVTRRPTAGNYGAGHARGESRGLAASAVSQASRLRRYSAGSSWPIDAKPGFICRFRRRAPQSSTSSSDGTGHRRVGRSTLRPTFGVVRSLTLGLIALAAHLRIGVPSRRDQGP